MNKLNLREKMVIKLLMLLIDFLGKDVRGFYPSEVFKEIKKLLESEE